MGSEAEMLLLSEVAGTAEKKRKGYKSINLAELSVFIFLMEITPVFLIIPKTYFFS